VEGRLGRLAEALGARVRRDVSLAQYTAMRVGGPADLLAVCHTTEEVIEAVRLARVHGVPWRVVGGGCNILVADAGVRGLIVVNRAARMEVVDDGVRVEAGELIASLAQKTVAQGLEGLEWAVGLPGTVGGAVVGNAGAFGGDVAGALRSAAVLGPDGEVVERAGEWFEFEYRTSRIKRTQREDGGRAEQYVVLAATFDLRPGDRRALAARAAEILEWRRTRHPSGATMGSTFKNPPGNHAGHLIDQAGLRGYRVGGAQISELHGNFFMNVGGASAADVLALIEHARTEVRDRFGVEMELEIELLGW